jgi:hypothetical protein
MQEKWPIAYFSEKLNGAALNCPTYDKILYVLVRPWKIDNNIFGQRSLWYIPITNHWKSQGQLNRRHVKWIEFIETFLYVIKYKQSRENVVENALLQMYVLLNTINTKLLRFEYIKELYPDDNDFGTIYVECRVSAKDKFFRHDGFLFKENRLCVPNYYMNCL